MGEMEGGSVRAHGERMQGTRRACKVGDLRLLPSLSPPRAELQELRRESMNNSKTLGNVEKVQAELEVSVGLGWLGGRVAVGGSAVGWYHTVPVRQCSRVLGCGVVVDY